jgi:hypothetical protein
MLTTTIPSHNYYTASNHTNYNNNGLAKTVNFTTSHNNMYANYHSNNNNTNNNTNNNNTNNNNTNSNSNNNMYVSNSNNNSKISLWGKNLSHTQNVQYNNNANLFKTF